MTTANDIINALQITELRCVVYRELPTHRELPTRREFLLRRATQRASVPIWGDQGNIDIAIFGSLTSAIRLHRFALRNRKYWGELKDAPVMIGLVTPNGSVIPVESVHLPVEFPEKTAVKIL